MSDSNRLRRGMTETRAIVLVQLYTNSTIQELGVTYDILQLGACGTVDCSTVLAICSSLPTVLVKFLRKRSATRRTITWPRLGIIKGKIRSVRYRVVSLSGNLISQKYFG